MPTAKEERTKQKYNNYNDDDDPQTVVHKRGEKDIVDPKPRTLLILKFKKQRT